MMCREHPFKIVRHAIKNIWLLIIPLLRALRSLTLDLDAFYTWVTGVWIDIIMIIIIIAFGYFRWLFTWCRIGRHHIRLTTGVFIKTETSIAYDRISAVTIERPFWLSMFNVYKIRINTRAKTLSSGDMYLVMNAKHTESMCSKLPITQTHGFSVKKKDRTLKRRLNIKTIKEKLSHTGKKRQRRFSFYPKLLTTIFYSLVSSSSLSGLIYIGVLIFNTGKIASEPAKKNVEDVYRIANDISADVSEKIPVDIPPIIMITLFVLAGTWLFSFISNLFRYGRFTIKKDETAMKIKLGILTERTFFIRPEKINYVDLKQTLIMKIMRGRSVHINCSGYGTSKFEHPVILPMLKHTPKRPRADKLLKRLGIKKEILYKDKKDGKDNITFFKPLPKAFISYISIPSVILLIMLAADLGAVIFFPDISHIVMFVAIMELIPMIWFITVKIVAFFTTSIAFKDDYCCLRYSRFWIFHTILVDKDKLVKTLISQDRFDKKDGKCCLYLYFSSEKPKPNKIKGLSIEDANMIISEFRKAADKKA